MATELRLPPLADTVTSVKAGRLVEGRGSGGGGRRADRSRSRPTRPTSRSKRRPPASSVKIHVPAGTEGLETGALLAVIDSAADAAGEAGTAPEAAAQAAAAEPAPEPPAPASTEATAPAGATVPEPESGGAAPAAAVEAVSGPTPAASPLARRMAAAAGLDLREIKGSGRDGRIGKADVERALAAQAPPPAVPPQGPVAARVPEALPDAPPAGFHEEPLSAMRRVTAERLQAAKQTVPHFYLHADCAMDAALRLRARLNERDSRPRTDADRHHRPRRRRGAARGAGRQLGVG